MIPQISQAPGVIQSVLDFLDALKQNGFTGDTATNYADRLTMATDNSIYLNGGCGARRPPGRAGEF